jgi:hypothetical protein
VESVVYTSEKEEKRKQPTFLDVYFDHRDLNLSTPDLERTFVFDVESDGYKYLVGYSPVEYFRYDYKIVDGIESLEALFDEWIRKGYHYGYAYNINYDMNVLLYYARKVSYHHTIRNLGDFHVTPNYEISRRKLFFEVRRVKDGRKLVFYDLFQFYQTSLANAYKAFESKVPVQFQLSREEEKEWLEDKEHRDAITDVTAKDVIIYNAKDVKVTAGLWHVAVDNIRAYGNGLDFGITLPMTAQYAISKDIDFVDYSLLDKADRAELYTALALSYRGGFFNSPQLGVMGKVFKYDVNSMYPAFMTLLPIMKYYGRDRKEDFDVFDLVCGQFSGNRTVPIKLLKQSVVLEKFSGCVWGFELNPALLKDFIADYGVTPVPSAPYEPLKVDHVNTVFRFKYLRTFPLREAVLKIYKERKEYKKQGNPYEKVLKILLNSSYGKYGELTFVNPTRERVEYASLITAMGRVFINSLQRQGVITYLTDSIISHEPLPNSLVGDELGYLKDETPDHTEFINVNNGIYSFFKDGQILDSHTHTRGFSKRIGDKNVAEVFFNKYRELVKQVKTPYLIEFLTYKQVMVKNKRVEDIIKKYNPITMDPEKDRELVEQIQNGIIEISADRPVKGLLGVMPVVIKAYNSKYVYTPFNGGISRGHIIKDMFSAMVLKAFLDKPLHRKPLWVRATPIAPKPNQVYIRREELEQFKKKVPDGYFVLKILYGEDHEVNKHFSIRDFENFTVDGKRVYALYEIPRKFIPNLAYFQMIRMPYMLKRGEPGQGVYVFDILPELRDSFASTLINPATKK